MRQRIIWSLIAILGIPVIAQAEEPQVPPAATKNPLQQPAPSTPVIVERGGTMLAVQTTEPKDSKYWIGLSCIPIDETLRSQLGLEAGSGLSIRQVADNSPAKESGLSVHDVISEVKIGDETHKPADIAQLTTLVQQAERKPMTFVLLRRGKLLNIAITPRERIATQFRLQNVTVAGPGQLSLEPNPMVFRMAGPVVALGGALAGTTHLPDDLTVMITKSGSQPVEITVRRKDRGEWKLKEKETAVQPKDISQAVISVMAHLSRLVGRVETRDGQQVFNLEPGPQLELGPGSQLNLTFAPPSLPSRAGTEARAGTPSYGTVIPYQKPPTLFSLQTRLDEIQKQLEQVTKALNELRETLQKSQP